MVPMSTRVQVLAVGGLQGDLCEELPRAAPCQTQLVPDSYPVDPLLVKAEPITKASGTSVKTYLRKDKLLLSSVCVCVCERGGSVRNNPADTKVKEGGGGGAGTGISL